MEHHPENNLNYIIENEFNIHKNNNFIQFNGVITDNTKKSE